MNNSLEKLKYENFSYINVDQEPEKELKISPLEIQTIEDLLEVIISYKIKTPTELIEKFPKLYSKAEKLKWIRKLYYYKEDNEVGDMKNYRTLSDVNEFIRKVDIKTKREMRKKYPRLFNKCWRNGWAELLEYVK